MSRHFKKDEFDMIYKIYNEFGLKQTINYINDISPDTNFTTRTQLLRRIKKIIRYKLGQKKLTLRCWLFCSSLRRKLTPKVLAFLNFQMQQNGEY
ncbi:hypothetical protein [Mesomycoplasma ovipneumoniae]|uniref:hypothetical protein n=1 Tax=Mesomycoplasma ovipneumoniae TaxID=29562 RepID=UPI00311CC323